MDNPTPQNSENKSLADMSKHELLCVLWQALNKANTKGVFTIDEAFTLKVVYDKICKDINE